MKPRRLSIAIDRYDRHIPLFMGTVRPPTGYDIDFLEVGMDPPRRHGIDRHRRMLVDREFDAAEVSLASFLVAWEKGMSDMVAVAVFPRRLFSHNHIFVSERARIHEPADLAGRRVAVWAFQVTMSVLAKGDLKRDYELDWRDVTWMTEHQEEIHRDYGDDVTIERLPEGFDVVKGLQDGTVDAYINPHPPEAVMTEGNGIDRLFPNWREATGSYYQRYRYYPIMHVLAIKREHIERDASLAAGLMQMFDEAQSIVRSYYMDPGYSMIMHARNTLEYEARQYAPDVWPSGFEANRRNLEDFCGYCVDQRIVSRLPDLSEIFVE